MSDDNRPPVSCGLCGCVARCERAVLPDVEELIARLRTIAERRGGNCGVAAEKYTEWEAADALRRERERAERAEAERDALLAANKDCMAHYDDARHDIERLTETNAELATDAERARVAVFEMYNDWKSGDFALSELAACDMHAIIETYAAIDAARKP